MVRMVTRRKNYALASFFIFYTGFILDLKHIGLHKLHRPLNGKDKIKQSAKNGESQYQIYPYQLICIISATYNNYKADSKTDQI